MSPECLTSGYQNKSSMETFKWVSAPKVARTKRYKDTIKASLGEFKIPPESWEQTTQACVKTESLQG